MTWSDEPPVCELNNFVNDTAIGDPLMTVPLNIDNKTSFFEASINNNIGPNDIINLCYELHGRRDAFVNLVSDECISVNVHYELVQPNEPREDINIIDNIHVRATDNVGGCRNIRVALNEGGVCTASVDGANIPDMYQANGISIRRYTNRVRIMVPNCEDVNLVMWVFCRQSTFWSTFRTDNNGAELTFQADMIKFVIARGFNLRERSHGIIGQFWNIPILVEPFTGFIRSSASIDNLYQVTIEHPNERREFTAWLYPLTWEYRREYCLYTGNQQAGPVYEVESPNDPVIEGTYADYIVDTAYGTDFAFTHFNERRCNSVVIG
ncbi:uncharacterized protein LOC135336294 [Halichondria panicea]|uniref:uncharacterized protein LOC135336294 n=1 Tax=Halichondria panicea TaxID=6063 RepID=UPI00312B4829